MTDLGIARCALVVGIAKISTGLSIHSIGLGINGSTTIDVTTSIDGSTTTVDCIGSGSNFHVGGLELVYGAVMISGDGCRGGVGT